MEKFFFGSQPSLRKLSELNFYHEYRKKYGETFVVWIGRFPKIYTSDADAITKVFDLLKV